MSSGAHSVLTRCSLGAHHPQSIPDPSGRARDQSLHQTERRLRMSLCHQARRRVVRVGRVMKPIRLFGFSLRSFTLQASQRACLLATRRPDPLSRHSSPLALPRSQADSSACLSVSRQFVLDS